MPKPNSSHTLSITADIRSTGSYILILHQRIERAIQIGRLGRFHFPIGYMAYVGSAFGPGGLESRLRHHLHSSSASPHWHIDYLRRYAEPVSVWITESDARVEHIWASALTASADTFIPAPGFGASDCKCRSHLFCFQHRPSLAVYKKSLRKSGHSIQVCETIL